MVDTTATQIEEFKCTITKMFKNCPKADGWFGCHVKIKNGISRMIKGYTTTMLTEGMQLYVKAVKETSDKYGDSWNIQSFEIITTTITGIRKYIASLPGISDKTAEKLVSTFGTDTIDIILTDPDKIKTTLKLSKKQITALIQGIGQTNKTTQLRNNFPELSSNDINTIIATWTVDPVTRIANDPYDLTEIPGIAFSKADAIARRMYQQTWNNLSGFDTHPIRVNHALTELLKKITYEEKTSYINLSSQNEYTQLQTLLECELKLPRNTLYDFSNRLNTLAAIHKSPIKIEPWNNEMRLYLSNVHDMESKLAKNLNWVLHSKTKLKCTQHDVMKMIRHCEIDIGITFNDEQKQAITETFMNPLSIITGGPGRGKTLIIDSICHITQTMSPYIPITLLAPTGKAVNKIKSSLSICDSTNITIKTIDSLIVAEKKSNTHNFSIVQGLVIIDEASMVDTNKMMHLLNIIKNCQICFVGDQDQLPPIDIGNPFIDMIDSGKIKTTILKTPMRNSGAILQNIDKINAMDTSLVYVPGVNPLIPKPDDSRDTMSDIMDIYNDEIQNSPEPGTVALIVPINKGPIGVTALNMSIQERTCPENTNGQPTYVSKRHVKVYTTKGYPIDESHYGDSHQRTKLRIGDIVMCTKNSAETPICSFDHNDWFNGTHIHTDYGVYNGDCGRIIAYQKADDSNENTAVVWVQFFNNTIAEFTTYINRPALSSNPINHLTLGYAMTVHKAQGSEYETVIYVSPHEMKYLSKDFATKNLLYTAFSRAKTRLVVVGSKDSITYCIKNKMKKQRQNLKERIK